MNVELVIRSPVQYMDFFAQADQDRRLSSLDPEQGLAAVAGRSCLDLGAVARQRWCFPRGDC